VVWLIASALFAFYVANFSSYDKTYGALAGVAIFLVWMWLTNTALLLGMELNAERERSRELKAGIPGADRERLTRRPQRPQATEHHLTQVPAVRSGSRVGCTYRGRGSQLCSRPFRPKIALIRLSPHAN
jgi:hypothetical protein